MLRSFLHLNLQQLLYLTTDQLSALAISSTSVTSVSSSDTFRMLSHLGVASTGPGSAACAAQRSVELDSAGLVCLDHEHVVWHQLFVLLLISSQETSWGSDRKWWQRSSVANVLVLRFWFW